MGYESRLYVVEKGCINGIEDNTKDKRWAELVATFDLCKDYNLTDQFRKYPATDCYFYEGENAVVEDKYGDPLKEIPIADAIKIIKEESEKSEYRRLKPCLALLEGFDISQWGKDLVVLHFGY